MNLESRKEFYFANIQKAYTEANINLAESLVSKYELELKYVNGDKKIIKQGLDDELIAKFHAIEIVATEDINQEASNESIQNLLRNKKLELLQICVEKEWLYVENYMQIINFYASFFYNIKFELTGKNVTYLNNTVSFLSALTKLKFSEQTYSRKRIFGFYVVDGFRLYINALFNLHPNLGIWKNVNHLIIPLKEDGWMRVNELFAESRLYKKVRGWKVSDYISTRHERQKRQAKKIIDKGKNIQDVLQDKGFHE